MNLCVGSWPNLNATHATDTRSDLSDRGGALMYLRVFFPFESSRSRAMAAYLAQISRRARECKKPLEQKPENPIGRWHHIVPGKVRSSVRVRNVGVRNLQQWRDRCR